jgi:myo-inositol 2-dehydrogenase/D-chiro-inositol 1-dehydrogenase
VLSSLVLSCADADHPRSRSEGCPPCEAVDRTDKDKKADAPSHYPGAQQYRRHAREQLLTFLHVCNKSCNKIEHLSTEEMVAIKFALLGCGRIGVMHARNLAGADGARLEIVFDPNTPAAEAVARAHGCRVASTAEEAIDKADAVLIATSTATHADLIELAAKAGKAILCEKPIDLSLDRVLACRKAIEGCNVPIQIGFNRRFDPGHRAAREACAAGKIGKLEQVVITSRDPGMPPRGYVAVSGGIFRDMTIHDFDVARFMLNDEPTEVFATGSALVDPTIEADFRDFDSIMVIMRTADGKLCHINNSRRATFGYDQRIELFGSEGMVISDNKKAHELKFYG